MWKVWETLWMNSSPPSCRTVWFFHCPGIGEESFPQSRKALSFRVFTIINSQNDTIIACHIRYIFSERCA